MEHEGNLSFEPGDDVWIFDDAISAGEAFVDMGIADRYEALRLTVLNHTGGVVDKATLRFGDIMGIKKIPSHRRPAVGGLDLAEHGCVRQGQ